MAEIRILKEKAASEIDRLQVSSIEMANYILDRPELSTKEFKATDYLIA